VEAPTCGEQARGAATDSDGEDDTLSKGVPAEFAHDWIITKMSSGSKSSEPILTFAGMEPSAMARSTAPLMS